MSVAVLIPGQGAQQAGMLHALPAQCAHTLNEASDVLGFDVLQLDSPQALESTSATQLALVVSGVAFARYLAAAGARASVFAGMSVGSFSAAVASESLAFNDVLHLVQRRAALMELAFRGGSYGMAVVEGLSRGTMERSLLTPAIVLASVNAPGQFVLAGQVGELTKACERAVQAGCSRACMLDIAVASHGPWLLSAAEELSVAACQTSICLPTVPLIGCMRARRLTSVEAIREELSENLAHQVMWSDVMTALDEEETTVYIEAPPSHTLTGLVHANLGTRAAYSTVNRRWDSLVREIERATLWATES